MSSPSSPEKPMSISQLIEICEDSKHILEDIVEKIYSEEDIILETNIES